MKAGNNEHEKYYLVADEVIFQVTHPALDEQGLRGELIPAINRFLSARGKDPTPEEGYWRRSLEFRESDSKIITFSSSEQCPDLEPFSLVSLKLKVEKHAVQDLRPNDVLALLNAAYNEVGDGLGRPSRGEGVETGQTRPGVPLDETNDNHEFRLNAIAPNSLSRSLDHGKGVPGPGSIPASRNKPTPDQRKFVLKGKHPFQGWSDFRIPGADVAILDTAIPLFDDDNNPNFPPDVMEIFNADPGMEVRLYPDTKEVQKLVPYTPLPHHYDVRDHGTFIASLIRSLTPSTKIYLHQVLNEYGVSSFMTISQGIQNAIKQRPDPAKPLIINCSFMLEHEMPPDWDWSLFPEHTKETLFGPMREVFECAIDHKNVVIVASAGNDGDPDSTDNKPERADPRYPAAFEKVLSVTALPKGHPRTPHVPKMKGREYIPATYANRAHAEGSSEEKIRRSFAIFGGGLFEDTTAPLGGALGVYIGKIPRQKEPEGTFVPPEQLIPNKTGWVQWSGTSFAAPVVAGLLAAEDEELFADNTNMPITEPKDLERPLRTTHNENVIAIRQG